MARHSRQKSLMQVNYGTKQSVTGRTRALATRGKISTWPGQRSFLLCKRERKKGKKKKKKSQEQRKWSAFSELKEILEKCQK